ncbi:YicC/YloC family endoribonuclease [Neisseria shayeganii]|uniref:YicC like protein n=1 Tax=Neisseria shayeganii 871 TaxID=1032488 RepID=G4CH45_9NEIS|nr:YicC/YloC family endoribonuclease [Neisseria shayeganii]EGY52846.1 YicC like protein [Neisseria shayeganii 871]
MIHSMTGFANGSAECGSKRLYMELRAVNHRYLDIQFKMPEELRHLEGSLREAISAAVARGKLECRIQLQNTGRRTAQTLEVDKKLVAQLADLNQKIRKQHPGIAKLGVADILAFPGVLAAPAEDGGDLNEAVAELLGEVLDEFNRARRREGEQLQQHLLKRLQNMDDIVEILSQLFPQLLQQHMDKAEQRLRDAVHNMNTERLQQEFAIFMQKADVDEEFSRLRTHIAEVRRIVTGSKGSVGKRLDFLMQELNREANTLGSKSIATECTQASVELKVLIEQMREQVQNIE